MTANKIYTPLKLIEIQYQSCLSSLFRFSAPIISSQLVKIIKKDKMIKMKQEAVQLLQVHFYI